MDRTVRAGRVRVTPALLLQLLGFSSEHRLMAVYQDDDWAKSPTHRPISLVIVGPSMPEVPEGHMAPEVNVAYEQGERGWPRMVGVTVQGAEQEASDGT